MAQKNLDSSMLSKRKPKTSKSKVYDEQTTEEYKIPSLGADPTSSEAGIKSILTLNKESIRSSIVSKSHVGPLKDPILKKKNKQPDLSIGDS